MFLQVFFEIQAEAAKCLENHFDEFKVTQKFEKMLENKEDGYAEKLKNTAMSDAVTDASSDVTEILGYTSARVKLENIQELIQNKLQAQEALQKSLRPDSKVLTNIQEEIQHLESERTELQLHIEQTDSWTENLGVWQCRVHQAGVNIFS